MSSFHNLWAIRDISTFTFLGNTLTWTATLAGGFSSKYSAYTELISAYWLISFKKIVHFKTWEKHKNTVRPHGKEWKTEYQNLVGILNPFSIFPKDIDKAFQVYMENPKARICNCYDLVRALKSYDQETSKTSSIESLYKKQFFQTKNGRKFQNLGKVRTRYRCIEINSGRIYLFNPLAEVVIA